MSDFNKYQSGVVNPTQEFSSSQDESYQFKPAPDYFDNGGRAPELSPMTSISKYISEPIKFNQWGLGSTNTNQNKSQQRMSNKMLSDKPVSGGSFINFSSEEWKRSLGGGNLFMDVIGAA